MASPACRRCLHTPSHRSSLQTKEWCAALVEARRTGAKFPCVDLCWPVHIQKNSTFSMVKMLWTTVKYKPATLFSHTALERLKHKTVKYLLWRVWHQLYLPDKTHLFTLKWCEETNTQFLWAALNLNFYLLKAIENIQDINPTHQTLQLKTNKTIPQCPYLK